MHMRIYSWLYTGFFPYRQYRDNPVQAMRIFPLCRCLSSIIFAVRKRQILKRKCREVAKAPQPLSNCFGDDSKLIIIESNK
jgi:hypothetical protein